VTTTQPRPASQVTSGVLPPEAIVLLDGLTKRFPIRRDWRSLLLRRGGRAAGSVLALDHVSLAIRKRELFGVLGPNGAGKTTLFKLLSTLIIPDEGRATVAGHDLVREPERVRAILTPVISDERSLNWRVSAFENLRFFAVLYGLEGRTIRPRIGELLETVGLSDVGHRMVGTFSTGMKQRLLIARALLPDPEVLLLDEPTRSLDPLAARRFRSFLRKHLVVERECTVLLATHNTEEALELCDRVAILDHGRVLEVGSAGDLSRSLVVQQYRARARRFQPGVFESLQEMGLVAEIHRREQVDEWEVVDFTISEGDDTAATVLAELAGRGTALVEFQPLPVTLADVIEQAVRRGGTNSHEERLQC
jgi:ABC-2 type transport system ATP-binding protein